MSMGCDSVSYLAFRFALIAGLVAFSSGAMAIGLGELRGRPALGDRPRFEVDILGSGKNLLDPACFRLQRPASDDNLPWLKRAIFTVRQGVPPVLEIVSDAPINDPALSVAIHVGCGEDVVREYMVMVSPPSARSLMAMEPVDSDRRPTTPAPVPGERARQPHPEKPALQPAPTLAPARLPDLTKMPVPTEQHDAERVAAEKIKGMEATVGELQQRAGDLTQKIEEAAAIPATKLPEAAVMASPPAADRLSKTPPAVVSSSSFSSNLYGVFVGALLVAAVWLGWRLHQKRKEGRQRLEVDPPRKDEREELGGINMQMDPVAMFVPPRIATTAAGASSVAQQEHSVVPQLRHDSTMSIAASTGDEHFEANPVMELAEIMLSFGRVKGAAQALQEYVDANPREALKPWMRLIDVYRMAGMRHEFEKAARELNKNFNVEVQQWDSSAETEGQGVVDVVLDSQSPNHREGAQAEGLESMSAIVEQLLIRWPAGDVVEYLKQLLRDNRGGTRLGFSLSVVDDILFLIELKEISNKIDSEEKSS